jgi:hypothetical protein
MWLLVSWLSYEVFRAAIHPGAVGKHTGKHSGKHSDAIVDFRVDGLAVNSTETIKKVSQVFPCTCKQSEGSVSYSGWRRVVPNATL